MPFCPNCGEPFEEGHAFCSNCGNTLPVAPQGDSTMGRGAAPDPTLTTPMPGAGGVVPPTAVPPQAAPASVRKLPVNPLVIAALAAVAVIVGIGGVVVLRSAGGSAQPAPKEAPADTAAGDATKEDKGASDKAADPNAAVYDAYEVVLDQADSYFADAWYDEHPDSVVTYTALELTGDDVPELLLSAHYSGVGSHLSGGTRYLPFVYDKGSGKAVLATSDEFELFTEPYLLLTYSEVEHAIIAELRSKAGASSTFYREHVDGTALVREEVTADAKGGDFPYESYATDDRTLIKTLRGSSTEEKPAEQPKETPAEQPKEAPAEQSKQEAEEAEHKRLVEEAKGAGWQVFTGTVRVVGGEEAKAYATDPQLFDGNGEYAAQRYRESTFAFLVFDEPQTVYDINQAGSYHDRTVGSVLLGQALSGSDDTASQWYAYDGKYVCVATGDYTESAGTDFPHNPKAGYAEVLYASDGASEAVSTTPSPSAGNAGEWVLPDSATRVYTYEEVSKLSDHELEIARNEIFARHGRGFRDDELQAYFNSKSWYERRYSPDEFDAMPSPLTDAENANVAVILQVEGER